MSKKRRNSNSVTIIALVLFAVALFALVPFVGDWVLDTFIYTVPTTVPTTAPTQPTLPSIPTGPSVPIVEDTTPPVITGAKDLEVYIGDTVAYKTGVSVTDNADAKPSFTVDNSRVNLNAPGVYDVIYTATDASGNTVSVTVKLTVKVKPEGYVDPAVIYAKADAILAQFIREDMTDREKAEAVYVWTRRSVHLTYGSAPAGFVHEEADWLQCAYQLINKDVIKGDCFFFYAAQKLLLQRLGIPTIDCEKIYDGKSHHYWLMVSVDGGKTYYHYDNVWSKGLCLVTDAVLDNFAAVNGLESDPFNRNKDLYPATPVQPLPAGELPWEDPAILAAKP